MKRVFSVMLCLILLLAALSVPAGAAHVSGNEAAETLAALGLLRGTEKGFELERSATRAESVAMLLRLLGLEAKALKETDACPFDDGGWAAPQLTYAWKSGLVVGRSAGHFGSGDPLSSRDFITMLLRALGYSDEAGDFSWDACLAFADEIGLCHGEYTVSSEFLREDMALLSYTALTLRMKASGNTLAEHLYQNGVISGAVLRSTRLGFTAPAEKTEYTAVEIHERCASAVFLVDLYEDEEALLKDRPSKHGSGFFITGDGVAALCYHELDGCRFARITTLDGRRYDVTGVLSYDALWDYALIRVSRTDLNGRTVRFFPYLDLGDSDQVCAGERIYTLSNALGLVDNITDGILSNTGRNVDDPDYLSIQMSAPISTGSSGGALLNRFGEVIGIIYGMFSNSQNMNLAVPINVIAAEKRVGDGISLSEVKRIEDEKKAAATLSLSQAELEMEYGEEQEILVTIEGPGSANLQYQIDCRYVVECEWIGFQTKHTASLRITAVGDGEAEVTISFVEDGYDEEYSAVIHVTVTGTPEEPEEEELPTGVTERE